MWSVSAFFTSYSALKGTERVEVIAVALAPGDEPTLRYVVVDTAGASWLARPEELNLYGPSRRTPPTQTQTLPSCEHE